MTADGVDPLHKIEGIMNQYMYKDILKEHLLMELGFWWNKRVSS